MAIASALAVCALSDTALAQTQIKPISAETCMPMQASFDFSIPITSTRVSANLGSVPSKLDQMRSVQNPGQFVALDIAQTSEILQPSVDCTRPPNRDGPSEIETMNELILGAQSIPIARTPFDRDWAAILRRPNSARIQSAVAISGARGSAKKAVQIEMVNRWVNRNIALGDDKTVYGRTDYWATASETLRRGIGDCEDFAIAKMDMLAALGVARTDMRLVIARDLVRSADHAVLVVKLDGGAVILDNVTDRLLDGQVPNDYRPIMSFSQNAKWVHGYSMQQSDHLRRSSFSMAAALTSSQAPDVVAVTVEPEIQLMSITLLSAPIIRPALL